MELLASKNNHKNSLERNQLRVLKNIVRHSVNEEIAKLMGTRSGWKERCLAALFPEHLFWAACTTTKACLETSQKFQLLRKCHWAEKYPEQPLLTNSDWRHLIHKAFFTCNIRFLLNVWNALLSTHYYELFMCLRINLLNDQGDGTSFISLLNLLCWAERKLIFY